MLVISIGKLNQLPKGVAWEDKPVNSIIDDALQCFWEEPRNPGLLIANQDGSIAAALIPVFIGNDGTSGVVAVTKYGCGLVETARYQVDYIIANGKYVRTRIERINNHHVRG